MTDSWKQWEGYVVNGEFPLQRYVGGSDHSAVFLTQRRSGEPQKAALKFIPADPNDSESQLLRWKLAMKVPHPQLIRVLQAGRCELGDSNFVYVVTEYADEDLSQILPHRSLTQQEGREVLQATVRALAYLHGKGFVHGQVKPTNIMAAADQVKLSSDGLRTAGETRNRGKLTVYDPPEAASGAVSQAGDVWALGMTLVEVLTQRVPARDGTRQPVVPRNMPEPFREIARNCLKLDPEGRWTLAQVAAHLEPRPHIPPQPAPPAPVIAEKKTSGRWRYALPAALALALVMLAGSRLRNVHSQAEPALAQEQGTQTGSAAALETPAPSPSEAKPNSATPSPNSSADAGGGSEAAAPTPVKHPQEPAPVVVALKEAPPKATPGAVLHQVLPDVSSHARNTIQGHVRVSVKVTVDESGNVTEATLASPGPSRYFARLATQAAQEWKFSPAQAHGQPVPSQWLLRFAFGRSSTQVVPVPSRR